MVYWASHITLPTDQTLRPACGLCLAAQRLIAALILGRPWRSASACSAYHQRHQAGTYGATSPVAYTAWQRRQLTVRCPSLYITSRALPCQHAGVRSRRAVRTTCTTG